VPRSRFYSRSQEQYIVVAAPRLNAGNDAPATCCYTQRVGEVTRLRERGTEPLEGGQIEFSQFRTRRQQQLRVQLFEQIAAVEFERGPPVVEAG